MTTNKQRHTIHPCDNYGGPEGFMDLWDYAGNVYCQEYDKGLPAQQRLVAAESLTFPSPHRRTNTYTAYDCIVMSPTPHGIRKRVTSGPLRHTTVPCAGEYSWTLRHFRNLMGFPTELILPMIIALRKQGAESDMPDDAYLIEALCEEYFNPESQFASELEDASSEPQELAHAVQGWLERAFTTCRGYSLTARVYFVPKDNSFATLWLTHTDTLTGKETHSDPVAAQELTGSVDGEAKEFSDSFANVFRLWAEGDLWEVQITAEYPEDPDEWHGPFLGYSVAADFVREAEARNRETGENE